MEIQKINYMQEKKVSAVIVKEFELELNQEKYSFKIGKFPNQTQILFSVNPKNNSLLLYEDIYSLDDLCKINPGFKIFNSISDFINALSEMMNNKKIIIEKNDNDNLNLKLCFLITNIVGKEDKVLIHLNLYALLEKEGIKNF